jgi:hypothetical protein
MSNTGVKNVYRSSFQYGKPFYAAVRRRGIVYNIGYFATVAEGAAAAKGFKKGVAHSLDRRRRSVIKSDG